MGSPLILEGSGIGKMEILEKAGIQLVHEISGVGANYQDHASHASPYIADPNTTTLDSLFCGEPETRRIAVEKWEKNASGLLSTNGIESAIQMRPLPHELVELGPEFTEYWNEVLVNHSDRSLFWLSAAPFHPGIYTDLHLPNFMASAMILGYPASRGYLHISSADPYAAPDFNAGCLSDPVNVIALPWEYKKAHEIAWRLPAFCGALAPAHPNFAPGSPAAHFETTPVPLDVPKIIYSAEDDKAIDANVRQFVKTTWHWLGTCAMKPLEQGGVVGSSFNVYGIKNLKVADVSIPPSNVNT
ncbi:GMC oxidoreductase-domain-containing protein, partial [Mycena rosella]